MRAEALPGSTSPVYRGNDEKNNKKSGEDQSFEKLYNHMNNIVRVDNFIRTLSTERFNRYLGLADNDTDQALQFYATNAVLSQSLYIPLQALEVTLRNSLHSVLNEDMDEYWFDRPGVLLAKNQLLQIGEAKAKLVTDKKDISSGAVIAALSFGFWTSMFKPDYEELWRHCLHKIVMPEKRKGMTRKTFSGPLEPIRTIRNRIAHHECIIGLDLRNHYFQIKNLTGLLAPEACHWIETYSIFEKTYQDNRGVLERLHGKKVNEAQFRS
ncbi:MAG: Abi family protein [Rhodospirillales bacterium]|nr:Abi family protein [Rhodospirillales bacterium]MCB9995039.1 Abi family protein [Rhodospirillales bacterium]